jgi:hypothetical protein
MSPVPLAVDPGLLARFRSAGSEVTWKELPATGRTLRGRSAARAHLHDEEARVERWGGRTAAGIAVDPGPVGALLIILEADRRGLPTALGAANAGRDPAFPGGSIVAIWGPGEVPGDSHPRFSDLVEIARYALR